MESACIFDTCKCMSVITLLVDTSVQIIIHIVLFNPLWCSLHFTFIYYIFVLSVLFFGLYDKELFVALEAQF